MTKRERKYHDRKKSEWIVTAYAMFPKKGGTGLFIPHDSKRYDKYGFPKPFELPNGAVPVGKTGYNMDLAIHKPNP